jgi:hypothetical protein
MKAILVTALALPVVGLLAVIAFPAVARARAVVRVIAVVNAGVWAFVASGRSVELGPFTNRPAMAAIAAGVALLLASAELPARAVPLAAVTAAAGLVPLGLSAAVDGNPGGLAAALAGAGALAALAEAIEGNGRRRTAVLTLVAAGLMSGGLGGQDVALAPSDTTASLLLFVGAAVVVLAALQRGPAIVLVPPALFLAVASAGARAGGTGPDVPGSTAVVLVAGAVAILAAARARTGVALAAVAVVAAASPAIGVDTNSPAALLLASAAVLSIAVPHPWVALTALPGAALLVAALPGGGGSLAAVVAVVVVATALLFARASAPARMEPSWRWLPGAATAGWLLVAPSTWRWVGDAAFAEWDTGAARAVAIGLVVLAALAVGRLWLSRRPARADTGSGTRSTSAPPRSSFVMTAAHPTTPD